MNRIIKKICFAMVFSLSIFILSGCGLLPMEEEAISPPLIEPEQVNYKTEKVIRRDMEDSITVTAYFVPGDRESHFFRYLGGRIKEIHVRYGDVVEKGTLLAELLTDDLENNIMYQQIDVDSKEKALEVYKKTSALDLELSREELAKAEKRMALMLETPDMYSAEEIRNTDDDINARKANLQKLELTIQSQTELKTNELQVSRLRLEALKNQLEKSRLYAKIDGQVTYMVNIGEGDYIDAYTTLAVLSDLSDLEIEYNGREASSFKTGMEVMATVKNESYTGEVISVPADVPMEEYERYRDTVRFRIDQLPEDVRTGDNARIKIILDEKFDTLAVPRNAVRLYMGNRMVYVLEDGLRIEKQVETGIEQGNMVEILDGLEEGELVIID